MQIERIVPLLRVADVARSMAWYRDVLGLTGDPFPAEPPHEFALVRRGDVELMLRRSDQPVRSPARSYDWVVYVRLEGADMRDVYAEMQRRGVVTRRLERMFYGLAEFEITDPDGHVLCLSQLVEDADDLPTPAG